MMIDPDARKAEWLQMRRSTWGGFTGLANRIIDSEAFQTLRSMHSVKVLIYFWQQAQYTRGKRKPGQESPIGNLSKISNQGKMSFEYRVAGYRGMRPDQFAKALRELFRYGFIDFSKHGCGVKGDNSTFALSDRWKQYNTPAWEEIPFPDSDTYKVGYRSEEFKARQRERRERERKEESRYGKAELLTTRKRSCDGSELVNDYGIAELKTPVFTPPPTTESRSLLRSTRGCATSKGIEKVRTLNLRSKSTIAKFRRDDGDSSYRISTDPEALFEFAAALSSIVGYLPDEGMAKRKPRRRRRTIDPGMAPRLDPGYDPDLGPWAEDEAMTAAIGRGGAVH